MKIGEILTERTSSEAAYSGNIGFEEVMKFFQRAEEENPKLAKYVEHLIAKDDFGQAWKYIQEFLGVNLKGPQFSTEEDVELAEKENPEQKRQRQLRDLQALSNDPEAAKILKKAVMARRKKLQSTDSAPKYTGKLDPNKKVKTYDLSGESIEETATAGATSAGNIASIPVGEIPKDQKAWAGKPGKMGKGPKPVKARKQGPKDNALNRNANLFSGEPIKR